MSVFFYGCVTLDGYLSGRGHELDWLEETGAAEETGYAGFYAQMDIALMGRRTFEAVAAAGDPAAIYPTTENYVFTHRPLSQKGFTAVSGDPAVFVEGLEREKNIWVLGGGAILASLLDRELVDHMVVQIAPVLLGDGIPLFPRRESRCRFCLEEVRRYGQLAEMVYRKI